MSADNPLQTRFERMRAYFFAGEDDSTQERLWRLAVLGMLCSLIFVLGVLADNVNPVLSYDRRALADGQVWRLLTGNFVHLNVNHMLMNVSVYMLAALLFMPTLSQRTWYVSLIVCAFGVSLGLWLFSPEVTNYVGLSGVLYGLVLFGLLVNLRQAPALYTVLYLYFSYKVVAQQFPAYDPEAMRDFIGGRVIVDAHLYGLLSGNGCAMVTLLRRWQKSRG